MQDVLAQVVTHILGVWRHRWLALALAWVIALAGWAFVWQMPESYVASARIYVDTNSILRPLMRGLTIDANINQRIAMLSQTLLNRPNLQKLTRMTDLDLQATSVAEQESLIQRLEDSIELSGERRSSSLYNITVTDPDRETARRIAQALITVFIETSISDKRLDSSGAKSFLERQIVESEQRLVEAENRLAEFKQQNVDVLPGERGDYYSRLQSAKENLQVARLQLREVENRRTELQRQIDGEVPMGDGVRLPIDERIHSLRLQVDMYLASYTAKHPQVVRLQNLIEELERERDQEFIRLRSEPGAVAWGDNPVYQGMRTMMAEAEAQAAELRVRVAEYQRRVEELSSRVDLIPQIEAQLTQLNRDYGVISSQHQQMLQRRESARLSGDVESSASDVSFRVIDPPFVPREPSHPNKPLLNLGVLLMALGGGVGAALLFSIVHPIITDGRMLSKATGLPLLGMVTWSKGRNGAQAGFWRLAAFVVCGGALLLAFAGVTVVPGLIAT
ncbi:chain length-determining protein [Haliea sp. E1-2-M8]|uniref:XrtA system polysaccharide chain length determinant n=1 Tax=Haliea sp. E1-2-M8 TaxID=3064706 RepID=UPI002725B1F8|nr:XrtA system polysaccharide chain length determinant [Haliea sp. E1-2-M8]MDO8860433.1 chain length-determining protein [Haliea sp. E1-2-M8]